MRLKPKHIPVGYAALNALGGGLLGSGAGFLTRSRYEERLKPKSEKTLKDELIARAPVIGAVAAAVPSFALGFRKGNRILKEYAPIFKYAHQTKLAALKKEVKLREHQNDLVSRAHANDGSLLVAHATGTGKTLSGIAAFESLKAAGKAKRALVVVPASLRTNFVESGIKKFTNSSVALYGPKGEKASKDIGHKSKADYNVVSYDLFREHGDKLIEDTGADTVIMDEVHRARGTEGQTYNKLRELRPKFKNAITLTGSVVNNEPNEIVPLLDITYGPTGHKLVDKKFFDNLFVQKDAETKGIFFPKTVINKYLKNKPQLSKYLAGKIDFISHKDLEKHMPKKKLDVVEVPMSDVQHTLYNFTMSSVDPITRWKIRNNFPVGQKEAQEAFGKLLQARQVSTDPAVMDKELLKHPDPAAYSPKIKAVVDDLEAHLKADPKNKSVIYGNLLEGQLKSVVKSLKHRGIEHATFFGVGNEGNSSKARDKSIASFQKGDKRVLLISGAGAEGLDLKNANLLQMLEGHYNPEKIQQAEARIRRMGSDLPEVHIKRYVSVPQKKGLVGGFLKTVSGGTVGGDRGVDNWIYTIAEKKDALNQDFRDVLKKEASSEEFSNYWDKSPEMEDDLVSGVAGTYANRFGNSLGQGLSIPMKNRNEKAVERKMKQMLLDRGYESLTKKMHYPKILAESKLDEKALDASSGAAAIGTGLGILSSLHPSISNRLPNKVVPALAKYMPERIGSKITTNPALQKAVGAGIAGAALGLATPFAAEWLRGKVLDSSIHPKSKDLDIGIEKYREKMRKKALRKYKGSKGYVQQYETKQELGIDDPF